MKRNRIHVLKAMIYKTNWGNIDNEIEIVGYVTVFIYKIRGILRSAGTNRKYPENYAYLELFKVNFFAENNFFNNIKLFSLPMQQNFSIVITL